MRFYFVTLAALLLTVHCLTGCGSSGGQQSISVTETSTTTETSTASYETVAWAKLWNSAFADEFNEKRVRLEAMWIGVAQSLMDVSAGFKPYNSGDWVEVGITKPGDTETMGQYSNQKWSVYIPKKQSDLAFALEKGTNVTVSAVARKAKYASAVGGTGVLNQLILEIEKIEKNQ